MVLKKHGVTIYGVVEFTARGSLRCESPVTLRDLTLGVPTYIGACSYISGPANLRGVSSIGRFCSMGNNINIGPGEHPLDWLSTSPFQYNAIYLDHPEVRGFGNTGLNFKSSDEVVIENDVWIGSNVTILRGVKISNGAVIAAGSVVTKNIPPYAIVGGVPAKIIRYRFSNELIESLQSLQWWKYDLRSLSGISFDQPFVAVKEIRDRARKGKLVERFVKIVDVDGSDFLEKSP